jgi:hypothetical protein
MSTKLCPHLILEGTRLTHKTDIAFALNEHPRFVGPRKYRYHSPIISAEWCALTNTPWGRGLINYEPQEEARAMEAYRTWLRLFQLLPYYSWIIDRFHLSTLAWQQSIGRPPPDLAWLDRELAELNFHLVLCTRRPETFAAARSERVTVSGRPEQYDDLDLFVREQASLQQLAASSRLTWRKFDVSDGEVARATDEIVAWMAQTGGLYQP